MVRLDLLNVGLIEETGDILVVMRDPEQQRLLVFETGALEGRAIALEAGGIRADRPLTQDLLHDAIRALGGRVQQVRIDRFDDDAFFATVVIGKPNGGAPVELDARPSDAVALAMRARAPIYAAEELLDEMGIPDDAEGRFADLYDNGEPENGNDDPPPGRVLH